MLVQQLQFNTYLTYLLAAVTVFVFCLINCLFIQTCQQHFQILTFSCRPANAALQVGKLPFMPVQFI